MRNLQATVKNGCLSMATLGWDSRGVLSQYLLNLSMPDDFYHMERLQTHR